MPSRRLQPRVLRDPLISGPTVALVESTPVAPSAFFAAPEARSRPHARSTVRLLDATSAPHSPPVPSFPGVDVAYEAPADRDPVNRVALPVRPPPLGAYQQPRVVQTRTDAREALPARPPSLAAADAASTRSGVLSRRVPAQLLVVPSGPAPLQALAWSPLHRSTAPESTLPVESLTFNASSASLSDATSLAAHSRTAVGPLATSDMPGSRPPAIPGRIYSTPAGAALAAALAALDDLRTGSGPR